MVKMLIIASPKYGVGFNPPSKRYCQLVEHSRNFVRWGLKAGTAEISVTLAPASTVNMLSEK